MDLSLLDVWDPVRRLFSTWLIYRLIPVCELNTLARPVYNHIAFQSLRNNLFDRFAHICSLLRTLDMKTVLSNLMMALSSTKTMVFDLTLIFPPKKANVLPIMLYGQMTLKTGNSRRLPFPGQTETFIAKKGQPFPERGDTNRNPQIRGTSYIPTTKNTKSSKRG